MRRLILLLILCLLPVHGWAVQNELDTDLFDGTNDVALPTYDAKWTHPATSDTGNNEIQGTPGVGHTSGYSANNNTGATFTDNHYAQVTVDPTTVSGSVLMVGLRLQSGTTLVGYGCGINPVVSGNSIYRIVRFAGSGSQTSLAAEPGSTTMQTQDVVNCQVEGTVITLSVTRGGSPAFTPDLAYDFGSDVTQHASGAPGIILRHTVANTRLAGDWRAGSVTTSGAAAPKGLLLGVYP